MTRLLRKCPFTDCEIMVIPSLFCCRAHWAAVPSHLKKEVYRLYNLWLKGKIEPDDLRQRQDAVIREVEGETS